MFRDATHLLRDLGRYSLAPAAVAPDFAFSNDEVGQAIIELAAGKWPARLAQVPVSDAELAALCGPAQMFVEHVMLQSADPFRVLGVSGQPRRDVVRLNYRRLMALVHPDVKQSRFNEQAASRVNRAYEAVCAAPVAPLARSAPPESRSVSAANTRGAHHPSSRANPGAMNWRQRLLRTAFRPGAIALVFTVAALGLLLAIFGADRQSGPTVVAAPDVPAATAGRADVSNSRSIASDVLPSPPQEDMAVVVRAPNAISHSNSSAAPIHSRSPLGSSSTAAGSNTPAVAPALESPRSQSPAPLDAQPRPSLSPAIAQQTQPSPDAKLLAMAPAPAANPAAVTAVAPQTNRPVVSADAAVVQNAQPTATPTHATGTGLPLRARIDALLLQFADAFSAPTASRLDGLLVGGSAGLRIFLANHQKLLESTSERSLNFVRVAHTLDRPQPASTATAVIRLTDRNGNRKDVRAFFEFVYAGEATSPRLVAVNQYVVD